MLCVDYTTTDLVYSLSNYLAWSRPKLNAKVSNTSTTQNKIFIGVWVKREAYKLTHLTQENQSTGLRRLWLCFVRRVKYPRSHYIRFKEWKSVSEWSSWLKSVLQSAAGGWSWGWEILFVFQVSLPWLCLHLWFYAR